MRRTGAGGVHLCRPINRRSGSVASNPASCCIVFGFHVAAAFHFAHAWSHGVAYTATARQTKEATGWDWGGGLYANYAFTVVWLLDAAWCWLAPNVYETRPRALTWGLNG